MDSAVVDDGMGALGVRIRSSDTVQQVDEQVAVPAAAHHTDDVPRPGVQVTSDLSLDVVPLRHHLLLLPGQREHHHGRTYDTVTALVR